MGSADRMIRLLFAVVVAVLYYMDIISGTLAIVLGVLAVIFALTAVVRVCPLYMPFGISTCKTEEA